MLVWIRQEGSGGFDMKSQVYRCSRVLLMLLASCGIGAAAGSGPTAQKGSTFPSYAQQHRIFLTRAQERAILRSVQTRRQKAATLPPGFDVRVGRPVPWSIMLHRFHDDATSRVWAVKPYDYVLLRRRLLIVSPQNRRIVAIISR